MLAILDSRYKFLLFSDIGILVFLYCVWSREKCGVILSLLVKFYQIQFSAALFSLIQAQANLFIQSLPCNFVDSWEMVLGSSH